MKRALLGLLLCLPATACNPYRNYFEAVEDAVLYEKTEKSPAPAPAGGKLKVANWNIKFGGARIDFFFDCYGDRETMSRSEVLMNMAAVAAKIRELDPDILLVQEIDVGSKRSAHVDQLRYLLDNTELNYGAYASQWRVEFIPAHGLGEMDSGNAILSRWPIRDAIRIALHLSDEQPEYERQYYLKRNILRASLDVPGFAPLTTIAVHADAYSKDGTKKQHIDRFKQELDDAAAAGEPVLAGGDLNTLPPGTVKQHEFDDTVCTDESFIADDYRAEAAWLAPLYRDYQDVIPLADYQADNARYYTHTVDGRGYWNRRLDYLFTNQGWEAGSGKVHQEGTMPLSDHAPVTGTLILGDAP
jgi:endonuclease/exonuclease/phosphatase family metal-dependent hydrolase